MTALAINRNTSQLGTQPVRGCTTLGIAANTHIFQGSLVARNAAGNAVPASALPTSTVVGVAKAEYDNNPGLVNAMTVEAQAGVFWFVNGGTSITIAHIGRQCYALDDQTVQITSGPTATPGTLPVAGRIVAVDATLGVAVQVGDVAPNLMFVSSAFGFADADVAVAALTMTRNLTGSLPIGSLIVAIEVETTVDWSDGGASTFVLDLGNGVTATLYATDAGNLDGGANRILYRGAGAAYVLTSTPVVATITGNANLNTLTGGASTVRLWILLP